MPSAARLSTVLAAGVFFLVAMNVLFDARGETHRQVAVSERPTEALALKSRA